MVMYIKKCDPWQWQRVQYGDVFVKEVRPRTMTQCAIRLCTCQRILTQGSGIVCSKEIHK